MTKWLGFPEASNVNGHMVKLIGQPGQKDPTFECQDCHAKAPHGSFAAGIEYCPKRPESLNDLTIRYFDGIESMSLAEQRKAAREHWLGFAKRVGMEFRTLVEGNDKYNNVLLTFVMDGVIYALNYTETTKGLEVKKVGTSDRMEAAE